MRNARPSVSRPTTSREVEPPMRIVRSLAEKIRIVEEYDAYAVGTSERGAFFERYSVPLLRLLAAMRERSSIV